MSNQRIYINANSASDGKKSDSYRTPQWLVAYLSELYKLTCDAAASHDNALFDCYYTEQNSAFSADWSQSGGVVFCNPPFSNGMKERFLQKAYEQMLLGVTSIFVIPADPSNKCWLDNIFGKATNIDIINGRVKFLDPDTGKETKAGIGTALVEFNPLKRPVYHCGFVCRDEIRNWYDHKNNSK